MPKAHTIALGGLSLMPDLSGVLHVPELETLIISDLHLEQGTSLARRGIRVPPFDTAMTLTLLEGVVKRFKPQRLVFLGDSFHDGDGENRLEDELLVRLSTLTGAHDTFWICGNHDPLPPQKLPGHAADHIILGPLMLRHEPGRLGDGELEICGHLHPGCGVSHRGRRVYGKCFIADGRRLIMPAFGAYTGALPVHSKPYAGLFNHDETSVWMLGREQIYKFPFSRTG
ncbi:ligase-associated DNA damage response endonuclease PdeM [Aestuariivirga litoralis]|uniref:ligase-associated DNA damage response endonuclease PdeM n=1 Tax=Aestuariivirga litoralis TaxID=2650924 RepID=UPI0018C4F3BD|nr:ligase-associated DNA damage response endonuclease PdeM [Aestuariivirga litoralis]